MLTREYVKKSSEKVSFQGGEDYYLGGRVCSVSWDGKSVRAEVQGSQAKPYVVSILFNHGHPAVRCTCAYHWGGFCKHGVAVFLYLIDHGETGGVEDDGNVRTGASLTAGATLSRADMLGNDEGTSLRDFLVGACEAPCLQLGLPFKQLQTVRSGRGILSSLSVIYQKRVIKIPAIEVLFSTARTASGDSLPALSAFSNTQRHFLDMLRGFARGLNSGSRAGSGRLRADQLNCLLEHVSGDSDIHIVETKSEQNFLVVKDPPIGLKVVVRTKAENRIVVSAFLSDPLQPERKIRIEDILPGSPLWLLDLAGMTFRSLHPAIDLHFLEHFLDKECLLEQKERHYFIAGVLPGLKRFAEVDIDDVGAHDLCVDCLAPVPRYEVDVERGELKVALLFDYGSEQVFYSGRPEHEYVECSRDGKALLFRRDIDREQQWAQRLVQDCKMFWDERSSRFFISAPDEIFEFLSSQAEILARDGAVFLSAKAKALYRDGAMLSPRVLVSGSGIDWFAYDIKYSLDGQDVDIPDKVVRDHVSAGRKFVRLKTGEFVKLDPAVFNRVAGVLADRERNGRLMLAHIPFVMDELVAAGIRVDADADTRRLYEELKGFKGIEAVDIPAGVEGVLRDYQRHGVNWLAFLKKFRFGGILADEMGLGKTLQALTMIQRDLAAGCTEPSLIVCPTTLVWNWEAEVRKFFPGLNPLVINGKDRRERISGITSASIIITSYALLRRDIGQYHAQRFNYLILDEAQNIKNRHTINARVVKQLNAGQRLALTGTPLENSIADIWSLFDFLMPSFLGTYERFRAGYEIPIMQAQEPEKLRELSRRIAPFVLRRLKRDVIKEIPDKIEQISFCELEPAQARIYAAMADKARTEAVAAYQSRGFQRSRMLILTLILRLRQICCHPELAGYQLRHRIGVSAKTDLLKETLGELISSGHRVLVFSQFVGMLGILRDHLKRENIVHEYMDGQTRDRRERVDHFNNDPTVKVFLLSLKVGGLGLNLTSADAVILYDPWWNPAAEQQAIDRVHRIGQKNSVLAYHLIARGTIEEKILEMQKRKKFLMGSLVLAEDSVAKKMDWEDIRFLLDIK